MIFNYLKCQASSVLVQSDKEPNKQSKNNDDEEDEGAAEEVHGVIMIDDKHARIANASYFEAALISSPFSRFFHHVESLRAVVY